MESITTTGRLVWCHDVALFHPLTGALLQSNGNYARAAIQVSQVATSNGLLTMEIQPYVGVSFDGVTWTEGSAGLFGPIATASGTAYSTSFTQLDLKLGRRYYPLVPDP